MFALTGVLAACEGPFEGNQYGTNSDATESQENTNSDDTTSAVEDAENGARTQDQDRDRNRGES